MPNSSRGNKPLRDHLKPKAKADKHDWFAFMEPRNEADGTTSADIYVYDVIGVNFWGEGVDAQQFVQSLASLDVDQINLYVNSPGGNVFDATAMQNALRRHPANVAAHVDGIAASAASFLIMAADTVEMGAGSELMIHDAAVLAMGNADDMRDTADILDDLSNNVAGLYAAKAGGTVEDWRALMREETWYTADEALEAGLADSVAVAPAESPVPQNVFDLSAFAHAGRHDAPEPPLAVIRAAAAIHPGAAPAATTLTFPDLATATAAVYTQDRPAQNQKEAAVVPTAPAPEAPAVPPTAPEAQATDTPVNSLTAADISNAVVDGLRPFLAQVQSPNPLAGAVTPGVPQSLATARNDGISYRNAMQLFANRAAGRVSREQREAIEATLTNGAEVFDALTNISLGDATAGGLIHATPPQWIGELITRVQVPGLWELIHHEDLTSPNVQAFVVQTEPTGGDKGDGGAAVTSTGVKWVLDTFNALRWAGADSFDRTPFDFGIQASALSSYFRIQLLNYYTWREGKLLTALLAGQTEKYNGPAPTDSAIPQIVNQILEGVVNVFLQGGGIANMAAITGAEFKTLIKSSREQAPAFLTLDLGVLTEGDVEGRLTVRPDGTNTLNTGTVLVANGDGVTGYELPDSPVRAEQLQVAIGNIDIGLFGYALPIVDSTNYASLVGQGS